MHEDTQARFVAALRDPALPPPDGVLGRAGEVPVRRFAVYRNNVHVSLVEALQRAYPVTERLVGTAFFEAMARVYVGAHLPQTPVLIDYGADFAAHVDGFEPARGLPYLGDVARLEWAYTRAYHAADAAPLALAVIGTVPPADAARIVLELHPSVQLVHSPYPILEIWRTNTHDAEVKPVDLSGGGADVLVLRPGWSVEMRALPPSGAAFLCAVAGGATLGEVHAQLADAGDFDLTASLAGLFRLGAIVGYRFAPAAGGEGAGA